MAIPVVKNIERIQKKERRPNHSLPDLPISELREELNMLRQMQEAFINTASHELRTPLTAIIGFSELLLNQATAETLEVESHKEMLGIILSKAILLESIIDTLLDIERFQTQQSFDLNKNVCRVDNVVSDTLRSIRDKKPECQFILILSEGLSTAWVDIEKIQKVLIELVSNAIKFSLNKMITVRGHSNGDNYCLSVQDEGPGVSAEHIENIFRPLYRVDSSSTAQEGLGLGLSWAKVIVEAHGGQLLVKSEVGQGTQMSIILPMWNDCADTANMDVRS